MAEYRQKLPPCKLVSDSLHLAPDARIFQLCQITEQFSIPFYFEFGGVTLRMPLRLSFLISEEVQYW